jgi:hypothetical protein
VAILEVIFALFAYWLCYFLSTSIDSAPMDFFGRKRVTWLVSGCLLLALLPMFHAAVTAIMEKGGVNPLFELPASGLSIGLAIFLPYTQSRGRGIERQRSSGG